MLDISLFTWRALPVCLNPGSTCKCHKWSHQYGSDNHCSLHILACLLSIGEPATPERWSVNIEIWSKRGNHAEITADIYIHDPHIDFLYLFSDHLIIVDLYWQRPGMTTFSDNSVLMTWKHNHTRSQNNIEKHTWVYTVTLYCRCIVEGFLEKALSHQLNVYGGRLKPGRSRV